MKTTSLFQLDSKSDEPSLVPANGLQTNEFPCYAQEGGEAAPFVIAKQAASLRGRVSQARHLYPKPRQRDAR